MVGRFSAQTRKARLEAARQGGGAVQDANAQTFAHGTSSTPAPCPPQASVTGALEHGRSCSSKRTNRNDGQLLIGDESRAFFLGSANAIPGVNADIGMNPAGFQWFNLPTPEPLPTSRRSSHTEGNYPPVISQGGTLTSNIFSMETARGNTTSTAFPSDLELQNVIDASWVLEPSLVSSTASQSQSELGDPPMQESVDSNIVQLAHTVSSLETQLGQFLTHESPSMDKVLSDAKLCMGEIGRAVESGKSMQHPACRALAVKAINLVVSLYEMCDPRNEVGHCAPIQFGIFDIDPEDQVALRKELLIREIHRCIRLIQCLRDQSWLVTDRGLDCGSVQHYVRLEQRASVLISSLRG